MKGRRDEVIGRASVAAILIVTVASSLMWQGCSKDSVTPRKSVVGAWECITYKVDGIEEDLGYEWSLTFGSDNIGNMTIYDGEIIQMDFEWSVDGDSLNFIFDESNSSAWYSCTNDRLTLRMYDETYDEIEEMILARVEEE